MDGSVKLNGTPIDKAASYRIVTNNFLSDGGDGFPAFKSGTSKYFGGLDIDAFADLPDREVAVHPGTADPHHPVAQHRPNPLLLERRAPASRSDV